MDHGLDAVPDADRRTARHLGSRVAHTAHTFVAGRPVFCPPARRHWENPELGHVAN